MKTLRRIFSGRVSRKGGDSHNSIFNRKEVQLAFLALLLVLAIAPFANAFVAPVAGSFAYDAYDIGVNKILKGPIGFVGGVLAIAFGAYMGIQAEIWYAIASILGGAILMKADTVVASLGALI